MKGKLFTVSLLSFLSEQGDINITISKSTVIIIIIIFNSYWKSVAQKLY